MRNFAYMSSCGFQLIGFHWIGIYYRNNSTFWNSMQSNPIQSNPIFAHEENSASPKGLRRCKRRQEDGCERSRECSHSCEKLHCKLIHSISYKDLSAHFFQNMIVTKCAPVQATIAKNADLFDWQS